MNGIGREFWVRVLILLIKKSRERERPVASTKSVQDVTDRPMNELIVVIVAVVVSFVVVAAAVVVDVDCCIVVVTSVVVDSAVVAVLLRLR